MKTCSRCGSEIRPGQAVCPTCGKFLRRSRQVRCRHCGRRSPLSLEICPACGERLQSDWVRPVAIGLVAVAVMLLVVGVITRIGRSRSPFAPARLISQIQALPSRMPVLVDVPTLTPTLTPSITPTPSRTPTPTPTPSLTPTPTRTPTPTNTPAPTATSTATASPTKLKPTATAVVTRRPAATPTATPTPAPRLAAPVPLEPENGGSQAERDTFRLAWSSDAVLRADQCFLVSVRYTRNGAEEVRQVCVQTQQWYVDKSLYNLADQETDRAYYWTVRVVSKITDAGGTEVYTPLSPPSTEWHFHWR